MISTGWGIDLWLQPHVSSLVHPRKCPACRNEMIQDVAHAVAHTHTQTRTHERTETFYRSPWAAFTNTSMLLLAGLNSLLFYWLGTSVQSCRCAVEVHRWASPPATLLLNIRWNLSVSITLFVFKASDRLESRFDLLLESNLQTLCKQHRFIYVHHF